MAVHDIAVQAAAKDVVLGTHGRSIYIADVSLLQQLSQENRDNLVVSAFEPIEVSRRWGNSFSTWNDPYEPSFVYFIFAPTAGLGTIKVLTEDGKVLNEWSLNVDKGINISAYDLTLSEKGVKTLEKKKESFKSQNGMYYLPKGNYRLSFEIAVIQDNKTELK